MSRRKSYRPSVSAAELFQVDDKNKPAVKKTSAEAILPSLGNKFFQPPTPQREKEDDNIPAAYKTTPNIPKIVEPKPDLNETKSLGSLTADFFSPPTPEQSFGDDYEEAAAKNKRKRSSYRSNKNLPILSAFQQQSALELRNNLPSKPTSKIVSDDPLIQKYEDYISQLHEHIQSKTGQVPKSFQEAHNEIQKNVQNNIIPASKANLDTSSTIIQFPSDQHNYNHITKSISKRRHIFHLKWNVDTAQGSFDTGNQWWKAPQFLLSCKEKSTNVRITLTQNDYHSNIGFYLFQANGNKRQIKLPENTYSTLFNPTTKCKFEKNVTVLQNLIII